MDEKFSQNNTSSQEEDSHSLVSAIRDKYEGIQPCSGNGVCQIYIPKNGPGAKGKDSMIRRVMCIGIKL